MFLTNLTKYIQSKDDKRIEPRHKKHRVTTVPKTDDKENEVTDLTDTDFKRKIAEEINSKDTLAIGILLLCMYIRRFKDVVDALVNFDSVILSICKHSTEKITNIVKKYGGNN